MAPFSIVTVTWQCAEALAQLIGSMNRFLGDEAELIVVDNASSDDPEGALRSWHGEKRFISLDENVGFGAANNIGVEQARHDAVVLLNPDTEVLDDSLGRLAAAAAQGGWLAGPRVLNTDRTVQPSASGPPVGPWPWLKAVIPGPLTPPFLAGKLAPWRRSTATPVTWLTGACIAGGRRQLLSLGPFDPEIHLYSEDLDLGVRAQRRGIPRWFRPDLATIVHHGDASTSLRFEDLGWGAAARNQRAVLRRAFGPGAERRAWQAERLRLRLNVTMRQMLGRDSTHERRILQATRAAQPLDELAPLK